MNSNVVSIDKRRDNQTSLDSPQPYPTDSAVPATLLVLYAEVPSSHPPETTGRILSAQQLYLDHTDDSRLLRALNLVERARLSLQDALSFDPSNDFVSFDQEIMKTRALLLKAFRYREIGEGYAALVNAVIWALANRKPGSPSRRQVNVIATSLDRLTNGPYMHFDTSMQIMDDLEEAGLDIEPPSLDILTAELDD
ncbi:MAG: hypothetical protein ABR898_03955 [Terracidiphilus sp.]|jgi:hypothetical protein